MMVPAPEILIRKCRGFEEYAACVRLQSEVWGYEVSDAIPLREFVVIERIGGQIIGAFDLARSTQPGGDGPSMVGFVMSMPGVRDSLPYLHSHMLAVLPNYRNLGIGRKLKLAQRVDALSRGITTMEWTFDPLEIKNAYLNIVRLGAVVRSYTPNFYGVFSSRLQAGLPTDRLHAEWMMDSPRVRATLKGGTVILPEIQESISIPAAIGEWKQSPSGFPQAEAVQTDVRTHFLDAFARGLTVVGFRKETVSGKPSEPGRSPDDDGIYLLAEQETADWS